MSKCNSCHCSRQKKRKPPYVSEEVWIERPINLFSRLNILPDKNANVEAKINALTRLLIVICIILAVCKWKYWYVILIVGLLVIFNAYLKTENNIHNENPEREQKDFYSNKEEMNTQSDRPVQSYYTKICIADSKTYGVMNIKDIKEVRTPQRNVEDIKITPKVIKSQKNRKINVSNGNTQQGLKIKGHKKHIKINKAQPRTASDFMKAVYGEMDESSQAESDTKMMETLLN